ncbi:MAG: permease [Gammaproteobacteria bacterium]|nr:permease [Gammaproteobacteria bacterium]
MIKHFSNIFKRIFTNEETVIFLIILIVTIALFGLFSQILTPFIISIVVAYLLYGLQTKIESYNVPELLAKIIAYSVFIIILIATFSWLIPLLIGEIEKFIENIDGDDGYYTKFKNVVDSLALTYPEVINTEQIGAFFTAVSDDISSITKSILESSISAIQSTIEVLIYIILFPILVYFFLFDRKNILNGFAKILPGNREMLSKVWMEMDVQLSNYARGKAIEILVVGVLAAILFSIFDLEYTAILAVLVGLSVLIPYVGAFVVTIPVVIIGLVDLGGLTTSFFILISLYLLLQFIDGYILVPIIFSGAVKLHPLVIIFAVFLFGSLFGFWGVFFSIPLATFIKAVWNAWPGAMSSSSD